MHERQILLLPIYCLARNHIPLFK